MGRYGDEVAALAAPLTDAGDLDVLLDRVGRARVVMLGEASHGTHEFYTWRAAISRRLIEEKGFSFVAVEGDWPDCDRVDRAVRCLPDAPADPRDALLAFERWPTWMWANEEVVDFTRWLGARNTTVDQSDRAGVPRPGRVLPVGVAARDPHLSARARPAAGTGRAGGLPLLRAVRRGRPGVRVGDPDGAHQL
jgi:hypothetical protein